MAQTLTRTTREERGADLSIAAAQDAIEAAIAAQVAKSETVARKGRMQYAIRALSELGVGLGLFTVESKSTKASEPKVLLTDREKAERIMARNETRGWRTSTEVKLVASGQAETFDAAKAIVAAEKSALAAEAAEPKAKSKPAPKGRGKASVKALTTTRAE